MPETEQESNMPNRYKWKEPAVVAAQVKSDNLDKLAEWCGGEVKMDPVIGAHIILPYTIQQSTVRARIGDYIVRDEAKDRYIKMSRQFFESNYERVD